jgi:hypothetical protein
MIPEKSHCGLSVERSDRIQKHRFAAVRATNAGAQGYSNDLSDNLLRGQAQPGRVGFGVLFAWSDGRSTTTAWPPLRRPSRSTPS